MLADPDSLLGGLQRGRGDALRRLMTAGDSAAHSDFIRCLCTEVEDSADMNSHASGYVEVILGCAIDLSGWHRWLSGIPEDADEALWSMAFYVLVRCAAAGHEQCSEFLAEYLIHGAHRLGLLEYAVDAGCVVDTAVWIALIPLLDDSKVERYVRNKRQDWVSIAERDRRVGEILRKRESERRAAAAHEPTENLRSRYMAAETGVDRKALIRGFKGNRSDWFEECVYDGLWDGHIRFRKQCILACNITDPRVVGRLRELAINPNLGCTEEARQRLKDVAALLD